MSLFIQSDNFAEKVAERKERERVHNWVELEENKIYEITFIQERTSDKYGQCWILTAQDTDEGVIRVWAPNKLVQDIKILKTPNQRVYFCSLGKIRYKKKIINGFDLVLDDTKQVQIDIFEDGEVSSSVVSTSR